MNILMLSSSIPSPVGGAGVRAFYFLRYLAKKHGHSIALLSLKEKGFQSRFLNDLKEYCYLIETVDVPKSGTIAKKMYTLTNMLSPHHLLYKNHTFLNPCYSPAMHKKVQELLSTQKFDLVFAYSLYTAFYVWDVNIPKIVDIIDAIPWGCLQIYRRRRNPFNKLVDLLFYYATKRETKFLYEKNFDAVIVTSSFDKSLMTSYFPDLSVVVIPCCTELQYFNRMVVREDFPSLIFIGAFGSRGNVDAVMYFYYHIYPLIRERFPNIKFYVVGDDPPTEIRRLSSNRSIVVTGFVEDVRPYLSLASVAVIPMIGGLGMKNKILEAWAMMKPVVSTSIGARGMGGTPNENIAIADTPEDFARKIVELLTDEKMRQEMGCRGRDLVEARYSCEKTADTLNKLFEEVVAGAEKRQVR